MRYDFSLNKSSSSTRRTVIIAPTRKLLLVNDSELRALSLRLWKDNTSERWLHRFTPRWEAKQSKDKGSTGTDF